MRRLPRRTIGASTLLLGAAIAAMTAGFTMGPAAAAAGPAGFPVAAASTSPSPSGSANPAGSGTDHNIGPQTPGQEGCALPTALNEVTGMVAVANGIAVIEGHNDSPSNVKISVLDGACKATTTTWSSPPDPWDPQDLTIGSDGAFWVADIGDTADGDPDRERIAVEKAPQGGGKASIYRMQYPGGAALDAQAFLLDKGDVPIILAHEAGGKTGIFKPATALVADTTENLPQLTRIGEFIPGKSSTPTPKGPVGQTLVTGAAKAPDGKHVVIRTMSDAYEFEVGADGDVAKAITTGKPAVTPLPNEVQGEAICYTPDGLKFQTLSVMPEDATTPPKLLTYTKWIPPVVTEEPEAPADTNPEASGGLLSKFTLSEMTRIVAAVGVVGLVLAIAGIIGIRRARRRRREEEEYDDYDDYDDDPRPRRGRGRGHGRGDDGGYGGLREPAYSGGYDDQGGYGADAGYGGNGYGAAGGYANGYGGAAGGYADPGYGADQYGAAQPGYGADQYGAQQYGAQPGYGADPYGAPAQPAYGADQYGADQYGAQQHGAGQYGGYGYEEEFDPLQDPRRR